jgi:hypothetical protein
MEKQTIKHEPEVEFLLLLPQPKLVIKKIKTENESDNLVNEFEDSDRKFVCEICNKRFRTKDVLHSHKKIHLDKLKCKICSKKFSVAYLETHLRWHALKKKCRNSCGAQRGFSAFLRCRLQ